MRYTLGLTTKLALLAFVLLASAAFAADIATLHNGFTIRHERREDLGTVTRLYFDGDPHSGYVDVATDQIASIEHDDSPPPADSAATTQTAKNSGASIQDFVNAASQRHGIDADLIDSVIRAESGFNPKAVSRKGAQGLMQLMPSTASKLGVADSLDPAANVEGGTHYLRDLLQRYDNDLIKALAAYNAGPERVQKYRGIPPYRETHAYVARVIADFNRKKVAQNASTRAASSQSKKERVNHPAAESSKAANAQPSSD